VVESRFEALPSTRDEEIGLVWSKTAAPAPCRVVATRRRFRRYRRWCEIQLEFLGPLGAPHANLVAWLGRMQARPSMKARTWERLSEIAQEA
jgi:glutathione S-transferase